MRCAWGKVIILLVVAVAVLQVIHMLLLSRLEVRNSSARRAEEQAHLSGLQDAWQRDLDAMDAALRASSVLDASGEFKVANFVAHSDHVPTDSRVARHDVTLVTQCSHNRVAHVAALARRWDGPMSVAVFAPRGAISAAVKAVATLRQCVSAIRLNTSFHLVYPVVHQELDFVSKDPSTDRCDCSDVSTSLLDASSSAAAGASSLVDESSSASPQALNYAYEGTVYPNNLLRNVARRNAQTEFVFVVDVDMVTNADLHQDFVSFARTNRLFQETKKDDKTVYVVPAFEAREGTHVPRDKAGLMQLIEQMQARPFYFELCWKCQKHTDYEAWQREPLAPELHVLFEVLWKDPWEPFYISRNTVPYYDERFKQYGFNRISQVCELHIAGYKFSILNNAFLVHHGLKTVHSFHRHKDQDQERNRVLFRQFKTELKDKYPDSSRRCY